MAAWSEVKPPTAIFVRQTNYSFMYPGKNSSHLVIEVSLMLLPLSGTPSHWTSSLHRTSTYSRTVWKLIYFQLPSPSTSAALGSFGYWRYINVRLLLLLLLKLLSRLRQHSTKLHVHKLDPQVFWIRLFLTDRQVLRNIHFLYQHITVWRTCVSSFWLAISWCVYTVLHLISNSSSDRISCDVQHTRTFSKHSNDIRYPNIWIHIMANA